MPIISIDDDYEYVALPPEERARIVIQKLEEMERARFTRKVEQALQAATGADPFPDLPIPEAPVIPEGTSYEVVEQIKAQHAQQVEAVEAERQRREEERRRDEQAAEQRLNAATAIFEEVRIKPETPRSRKK